MPHLLYNHITHSWDRPDPDDGGGEHSSPLFEAPDLSARARRTIARLALASGAGITACIAWGLIAGILFGVA